MSGKKVLELVQTLCRAAGLAVVGLLALAAGVSSAADMTFPLVRGLNGITLPYEGTGIADAEGLCQAVPDCVSVWRWDGPAQGFVRHARGSGSNNFPVMAGYPYFVEVSQDTSWTVSGTAPAYVPFALEVTAGTDVNAVGMPVNRRLHLTDAEALCNDIPNCEAVWKWDATTQGFSGHPKGTPFNNFQVKPGHAYLVSVTAPGTWPVDAVDPTVAIQSPLDGAFLTTTKPLLSVQFQDADSGIDPSSLKITLDGSDITAAFTVTATGASYQPTSDLAVGAHELSVSVSDHAGNTATATANFQIGVLRALPSANPTSGPAPLQVRFTSRGEDPFGTIVWYRWDFDGDGRYDRSDTVAADVTYTYRTPGTYQAVLRVESSTGDTATATVTITVENNPPTATADVVPSNGAVPLTVQLLGSGSDPDGSIVLYEWDYEGDGTFDYSSTTSGNTSHTYDTPGEYQAVFRVTDNSGQSATAVAAATVVRAGPPGSPTATASASPTRGTAPLTVTFTASATDPDGDVTLYEWDFDGDGTYDWSSSSAGSTTFTYTAAGTHVATLRVTDSTGLTGIDQVLITVDIQTSLSVAENTVGFFDEVALTATASSSYSSYYGPSQAVDGNSSTAWWAPYNPPTGTWIEVALSVPRVVTAYTVEWNSANYRMSQATLELFDPDGNLLYEEEVTFPYQQTHQVVLPAVQNVRRIRLTSIAHASVWLSITEISVENSPMPGQENEPVGTDIVTTISADTTVTVLIRDAAGNVVRTLVDNEFRQKGTYRDYWDTRGDGGVPVNDGLYYAILRYVVDGQPRELDLTHTTGGQRSSFPTGGGCNRRDTIARSFSPYDDQLLPITFRLCEASEVTVFVGPLWSGGSAARIRTIVNRMPFPKGEHTVYWDGLDDQNNIAHPPPGDSLILGMWRYTLPDNAMYMTGGRPQILALSSDPNYYNPLSKSCVQHGDAVKVAYTVSEPVVQVTLQVIDLATKSLVRTVVQGAVDAGDHVIAWDGKNNQGKYVDAGDYQVLVTARDAEGNESMLKYVNLIRVYN
ncbi:PKD domain-containing protein [Deferrisoma sp.]